MIPHGVSKNFFKDNPMVKVEVPLKFRNKPTDGIKAAIRTQIKNHCLFIYATVGAKNSPLPKDFLGRVDKITMVDDSNLIEVLIDKARWELLKEYKFQFNLREHPKTGAMVISFL